MFTNKVLLVAATLFIHALAIAQTKKGDSLNWFIQTAKTDEEKIQAIINYTDEYFNISKDSLDKYAHIAIELAGKTKNEILKSEAQLMLANNFVQMGWTDSAYNAADAGLKKLNVNIAEQRSLYFRMSRAKAVALGGEGRLEESLDVLYKILPDAEKYKDSLEASIICNTLSFIANARNELPEGIKWNDKALQYAQNLKPGRIGSAYVSRANLYNKLNKKDSALYFVNTAIELLERDEFLDRLVSAYRLKSAVLSGMNKLPEAEKALMSMIEYRKKLNQQQGFVVEDNIQIADFYASTGQLNRAIELCKFYLQRGDETKQKDTSVTFNNDVATRLPYYTALAGYLKDAGDTKGYIDALENIVALKDSVYELNNAEAIAEMQTKYNVQEKEKTILAQELQLTRHNILLFGSLGFTVMAAIIGWLIFRNQRRRQKEKMQQAIEEEKRAAAQSILAAEERERKRIAADLHDNIGAYATAISADVESITGKGFARSEEQLQNLRTHSQEIIYSLRDTIWVLNKDNITITGISDRIKNYINKLKPAYGHISINVNENIQNDIRVGSQKALNIFRIVQEAIHNALKHSAAKNISILITSIEHISITVKDDGKGISNAANSDDNGLRNMQARAADSGIKLTVQSASGKGTSILLETTAN